MSYNLPENGYIFCHLSAVYGSHTELAYSSFGLRVRMDLYARSFWFLGQFFRFLRRTPNIRFPVAAVFVAYPFSMHTHYILIHCSAWTRLNMYVRSHNYHTYIHNHTYARVFPLWSTHILYTPLRST